MLIKYQTTPELDVIIQDLMVLYNQKTATGAVKEAVINLPDCLRTIRKLNTELSDVKFRLGEAEAILNAQATAQYNLERYYKNYKE